MKTSVPFIDRLVREQERKAITAICRTTAWELEKRGEFPKRRQLYQGSRQVGWVLSELQEWVRSRQVVDGANYED